MAEGILRGGFEGVREGILFLGEGREVVLGCVLGWVVGKWKLEVRKRNSEVGGTRTMCGMWSCEAGMTLAGESARALLAGRWCEGAE